jgi:hypothetical protein
MVLEHLSSLETRVTALEAQIVAIATVTLPPMVVTIPYASQEGDTLACSMGTWRGEPTNYAYSWKRDGTTDVGSGDSYTLVADDAGHSLACVVTATNANGATEAPPSNAIAVPEAPPEAPPAAA